MISKATPDGTWSNENIVPMAANIAHGASADVSPTISSETPNIELTTEAGWSELIRDIVAMANSGGGRLVVHCVASDGSAIPDGRVFSAPIESIAKAVSPDSSHGTKSTAPANLQPVRIVTDPEAPALQPQDVDHLYPWRQKDLLRELNSRLGRRALNSYDIQAVRRQHHLDERPDFVFNLPGAGRRYSPAVAEWIMDQQLRDPEFFHRARTADHEIMKLRRHKPR